MPRRTITLVIAAAGVLACLVIMFVLPVPYVALLPGPTYNTLGPLAGKPVIQVSGHRTFPTTGHLNMVTVSYIGGPGASPPFNIFRAIQAWLSPHEAVVPQSELFPPNSTQQQVVKQDTEEMAGSQQMAQAAALCQLGIKFTVYDSVISLIPGLPAAKVLHTGDEITAVNGTPLGCRMSLTNLIQAHPAGQRITLTVLRKGRQMNIPITTASYKGGPVIGVYAAEAFRFPFTVKINIGSIGGPSAGMMFALGIIDKITSMNLADGRFIAGTGEITIGGAVQPIGGIQQKMAGARAAGATIFLTPAANCPDTVGAVPPGMRLVKVSTLSGAIAALKALREGKPIPGC